MRRKKNIVLLALGGSESQAKSRQYESAARALGLEVAPYPDGRTLAVLPCTDSLATEAAWLAHSYGVAGPDPLAVSIAVHKPLAYRFLESRGFGSLFWYVPLQRPDLDADFDRPVIVKPERGTGSYGPHPWGYRAFASVAAFRRYLQRERLMERFLANQLAPLPNTGRYLLMEYIGSSAVHSITAVVGARKVELAYSTAMTTKPGTPIVDWMLFGFRHPRMRRMLAMIEALAEAGLRRSVVYLQCVDKGGELFPIDVNLRPGSMWNEVTRAFDIPFFPRALAFMLDQAPRMRIELPAPYVGVRLLVSRPVPGHRKASFGAPCVPLVSDLFYDPKQPSDRGRAWPMFAIACGSRQEFERRAALVARSTRIAPVR